MYKIGNPYRVGSVWYYPEENFHLVETGIASWYGPDFHGGKTANGEIYDQNALTAAHRTLQLPSVIRVTNLENGRSVVVRVNDRGPYLRGRILDVSKRAAELLGFIGTGTARVRVEVLEGESRKVADMAKRGMDTSRVSLAKLSSAAPPPQPKRGPQMASLRNDAEALPESLQTPTITVEELNAPGRPLATPPPSWNAPSPAAVQPASYTPSAQPLVTTSPVHQTQIFVQAGAFGVQENAQRLKSKLSSVAPVIIDPVTTSGGRKLWRVKLGPMASVAEADAVLDQVVRAGADGARVVGH
jgi:rare lipoprotein A